MEPRTAEVVGLLVGGGALPAEIAAAITASGKRAVVIGLAGEADPAAFKAHDFTLLRWGEIGRLVRTFKAKGVRDLVIVGRVSRPDMSRLKTDLGFWLNLPRILRIMAAGGDDGVLRRVIRFFEGHGFRVIAPADAAPALLVGEGPLATRALALSETRDAATGFEVIARLAPFDIGQAVAIARGRVLAIEGVEGTDRMLERIAPLAHAKGGVLVKGPKPGQEMRVDMPVIGPQTIERASAAGLAAIAVRAGQTLAADRTEMIAAAARHGLAVEGCARLADPATVKRRPGGADPDAATGAGVILALRPLLDSRGVVVVRNHVLAVEAGEGLAALLDRAGGLRQWGRSRWRRRRGTLTVRAELDLTDAILAHAASMGLAAVCTVTADERPDRREMLVAAARQMGLDLIAHPASGGGTA